MKNGLPDHRLTILEAKSYRRDLARLERSGRYDLKKLDAVIDVLASGRQLPSQYRNHSLKGDLAGREECHIQGDWLLVYRRSNAELFLYLLRTGTHSQLFGE